MSLNLSWRSIATTSACLCLALLVTLAVVVASQDTGFLSTLALALAVIAFIVQIIVFIAQSAASTSQLTRAEELHGATLRALATIEEKTEGTRQTVNTINDQMLSAVLGKVLPGVGGDPAGANVEPLRQAVEDAVRAVGFSSAATTHAPWTNSNKAARLDAPTDERLERAAQNLDGLDVLNLNALRWLGRDYMRYGSARAGEIGHGIPGAVIEDYTNGELHDRKLVRQVAASWGTHEPVWILTDEGLDAAALIVSGISSPNYPPTVNRALRKMAEMDALTASVYSDGHAANSAATTNSNQDEHEVSVVSGDLH